MIADTFHNCTGTGVTDTEPFSRHTVDECLTTGCTIERHISDNDVFICCKSCILRRINNNLSSGKSLAKVIVAVSAKRKRQSFRDKGAEALSSCALAFYHIAVFRKAVLILSGDFRTKQSTKGTVDVADLNLDGFLSALLQCRSKLFEKNLFIQSLIQFKGIDLLLIKNSLLMIRCIRIIKDIGNINVLRNSL